MGASRSRSSALTSGGAPQINGFAEALLVQRADITLTEAVYTANGTAVDVRPAIEAWIGEDDWPTPLRISPAQLSIADFAPGDQKTLRLRFDVAGAVISTETTDGDWLLIGGPASLGLGPVAGEPLEVGDMRIHAAWYGHTDRHVNVLPALRDRLDEAGRIDTRASNGLAGIDPAVDRRKSLTIYFERDGAFWQATYSENDSVRLPLEQ